MCEQATKAWPFLAGKTTSSFNDECILQTHRDIAGQQQKHEITSYVVSDARPSVHASTCDGALGSGTCVGCQLMFLVLCCSVVGPGIQQFLKVTEDGVWLSESR